MPLDGHCVRPPVILFGSIQSSLERHGRDPDEEAVENKLSAEMNARVALDAEAYYRVGDQRECTTLHEEWGAGGRSCGSDRRDHPDDFDL
jgi:hypothetical protein